MAAATPICCRAPGDGCGKSRRAAAAPPVEKLAEYHAAPPLQGFGISAPEQVSAAIDAGAAGAISGSAIVKIIERHLDEPQTMLDELKAFVQSLKAATKTA